jgi:hypothetical protein
MTKLTDAQTTLLAAAGDGAIEATGANRPTAAALIKRGLMISVPQAAGGSLLMVTEAGRAAIGVASASTSRQIERTHRVTDREPESPASRPKGKIGILLDLLVREGGATIEDMMAATGWQAHSVRGAISGAVKKTLGLNVISEKTEAGRTYRVVVAISA